MYALFCVCFWGRFCRFDDYSFTHENSLWNEWYGRVSSSWDYPIRSRGLWNPITKYGTITWKTRFHWLRQHHAESEPERPHAVLHCLLFNQHDWQRIVSIEHQFTAFNVSALMKAEELPPEWMTFSKHWWSFSWRRLVTWCFEPSQPLGIISGL